MATLLGSKTSRRSPVFTFLFTTSTNDALMDSCFDTVVHLKVELGKLVCFVSGSFLDITKRGSIYNVTNDKTLDGLVLGDGLSSGNAPVVILKMREKE